MGRGSQATNIAAVASTRKKKQAKAQIELPQWLSDWMEMHGPYLYHGSGNPETRRAVLSEGLIPWN